MKPTDIIFRPDGRIYHLGLAPEEIAPTVILTGDPGRVETFSHLLDRVEVRRSNREFQSATGTFQGRRLTFLSTGIGTDNIEIAAVEMDALARRRPSLGPFRWIRVGTCGALHPFIQPGDAIMSRYAIGLDNLAHFYPPPEDKTRWTVESALKSYLIRKGVPLWPYVAGASSELTARLSSVADHQGLTVCAPGFFAPQGRLIPISHPYENLPDRLVDFEWKGLRILNFEMEVSALYLLAARLGHQAAVIDIAVAIRPTGQALLNYQERMTTLLEKILHSID